MTKTCKNCGRKFEAREEYHQYCFDCFKKHSNRGEQRGKGKPRKQHQRPSRPDTSTNFVFGPDYLKDGYFYEKGGNSYLRAELLSSLAMDVAKLLGNRGMKTHQIRRIFNKVRGIETKLKCDKDFEEVIADIVSLRRDVAYQVGRQVTPEESQQFIDRNVELSAQNEDNFVRGFMQHFESVLAYFVYYFRD